MLAEEGYLCSDIGKSAITDVGTESCEKAMSVIEKINPDVDTSVMTSDSDNRPKGCFMRENTVYFNSASGDTPYDGSRQVCQGTEISAFPAKLQINHYRYSL